MTAPTQLNSDSGKINFDSIGCTGNSELQSFMVTDFNSPFMIMWFNTSFLSLSFFIEFIYLKFQLKNNNNNNININNNKKNFKTTFLLILKLYKLKFKENNISFKKLFFVSIPITIVYVGLSWCWLIALSMTEVSISTAISQSSSVFCFILSIIILKEKIEILKTISVLIFMGGIVGITVVTANLSKSIYPNAIKGDLLIILSAALWAVYEVMTSKFIGNVNRTAVNTYIGFIGLIDLILGIPFILILNSVGFEPFQIPSSAKTFGMLLTNAIVGASITYLINWGLSITSPLFVRSGELMAIPLTLLFDIIVKHMKLPLLAIPGYILIVVAFILSIFIEARNIKKQKKEKEEGGEEEEEEKQQNIENNNV
ncbi:hypothetical protein ACTFIZ_006052 [Dictyostelium cf. discoideum]